MRLVIDGHRLTAARTGVGRVLEMLLDEWSSTGWPVERPLLVTQEPVDRQRWFGLEIVSAGPALPGLVWRHTVLASKVGRQDVLFCPTNLLPRTIARKTVVFVFDTLLESVPETFSWQVRASFRPRYRSSARRASALIVPSTSTKNDVIQYYGVPEKKVRVVPLAADPVFDPGPLKGEPGFRYRQATPYFMVVGKNSKRRNRSSLLTAFAEHRWSFPDDRLLLIGPDEAGNCDGNIVAFGHIDDQDLAALYRSARATLYLSDYEGFGLPILEAQSCGCPVVTLRNSALAETAGDGALFLDKPGPESIQEALSLLSSRPDVRADLSLKGLNNAARFSRVRMAAEVGAILREVAGLEPVDQLSVPAEASSNSPSN